MIKTLTPVALLALGLAAAPLAADSGHREHRIVIHDDEGAHTVHVTWDEDEFERDMERFAAHMERFGEHMGRIGERIGRDVERAMEDVDWDEVERHRGHRHHGREIVIHGDDLADAIEGSVQISLAAAFEALDALGDVDFDVRFDEVEFERDMERLDRDLQRLDTRRGRDLEQAMEELERQMEKLERELDDADF